MKKITLLFLFAFVLSFGAKAQQNTIWSDDFNDEDISDWTLVDADGDGNNWGDLFQVTDGGTPPVPVTPVSLISRSWQGSPLTPDNWATTSAIDLTTAGGVVTLEYITQVPAASWDQEYYSVYVSTTNDINLIPTDPNTVELSETLGDAGDTGAPTPKSVDISALSGAPVVYVTFRHHNVTDMDFISIDDAVINATVLLSVNEFDLEKMSHFYNKNTKELSLDSANAAFSSIEVYNILGQQVVNKKLSNKTESISMSSLTDGVYLVKVFIGNTSKTIKVLKQ
ncbi:T9SS type A sorting domain-containing protein [Bizionia saleffrena]|uniref:T9SS type A sorting domain-containing protein n=1 Tax=Bizionia saleffrena TaxID=291189 RepID=A0A8H2QKA9_9FLAO|nr:T9SS type A sorting domain-containing protein [Bizionia saleffrena]TYB77989.1 T9SS type A sorting domain-containing protein [Bizionia saleffrena]